MASAEDDDRDRQHPGRRVREAGGQARGASAWSGQREAVSPELARVSTSPADPGGPHAGGWGSQQGGGFGGGYGTPVTGASVYGSGRWGAEAQPPGSAGGYCGQSASGYGQSAQGQTGYGQLPDVAPDRAARASSLGQGGQPQAYGSPHGSAPGEQAPGPWGPPVGESANRPDPALPVPDLFEQEYRQWREEQVRKFDHDYQCWRQDRYRKFAEDFNRWRLDREGGADAAAPNLSPPSFPSSPKPP